MTLHREGRSGSWTAARRATSRFRAPGTRLARGRALANRCPPQRQENATACPPITLNGVTAAVWKCLRDRASEMGINLPEGVGGTLSHPDADAEYAWDEAAGTLTVTFTRVPSGISCGDVEARFRHAATPCGVG